MTCSQISAVNSAPPVTSDDDSLRDNSAHSSTCTFWTGRGGQHILPHVRARVTVGPSTWCLPSALRRSPSTCSGVVVQSENDTRTLGLTCHLPTDLHILTTSFRFLGEVKGREIRQWRGIEVRRSNGVLSITYFTKFTIIWNWFEFVNSFHG